MHERAVYRIIVGGNRSTEDLVDAGRYGYAHSCVISENFPTRSAGPPRLRDIVFLEVAAAMTVAAALAEAAARGLMAPTYEEALHFGIAYPDVQRDHPLVFLHEPWLGYFNRRDVLMLWCNAGRRELGLEGFDDPLAPGVWLGFVRTPPEGQSHSIGSAGSAAHSESEAS